MEKIDKKQLYAGEFWLPEDRCSNQFVKKFGHRLYHHRFLEVLLPTKLESRNDSFRAFNEVMKQLRDGKWWTGAATTFDQVFMIELMTTILYVLGWNGPFDSRELQPEWTKGFSVLTISQDVIKKAQLLTPEHIAEFPQWFVDRLQMVFGLTLSPIKSTDPIEATRFKIEGLNVWSIITEDGKSFLTLKDYPCDIGARSFQKKNEKT
jgi:hypothetical protein